PHAAGAMALPDRVLLDSPTLLGACTADPARLRGGAHPDASRGARHTRDDTTDPSVLTGSGCGHGRAVRLGDARPRLSRCRSGPRRRFPAPGREAAARHDTPAGVRPLPFLASVPRAA